MGDETVQGFEQGSIHQENRKWDVLKIARKTSQNKLEWFEFLRHNKIHTLEELILRATMKNIEISNSIELCIMSKADIIKTSVDDFQRKVRNHMKVFQIYLL